MIIPVTELPADTLLRIVEDYVTRDGTDYGEIELSLAQKSESLLRRIRSGEVVITFDEATESINLISKQDYLSNNALNGVARRSGDANGQFESGER